MITRTTIRILRLLAALIAATAYVLLLFELDGLLNP